MLGFVNKGHHGIIINPNNHSEDVYLIYSNMNQYSMSAFQNKIENQSMVP